MTGARLMTPSQLFDQARQQLQRGDFAQAEAASRRYLQLQPEHPEGLVNLGICLASQGKLEEAVDRFRRALQIRPDLAQAHLNLGVALAQLGSPEAAEDSLREALRLHPAYAEAHYNLGNTLWAQQRQSEAEHRYRQAIRSKPDYADACNNLGLLLTEEGRLDEAEVLLRQAVRLAPKNPIMVNNLGLALADQARWPEAVACYEEALRLDPNYAEAHANLGSALKELGRGAAALACYDLALAFQPDDASIRWNRALVLLQRGEFEAGWSEYEWRWRRKQAKPRRFAKPRWDGSPLHHQQVLVWTEQGLGDVIQFVRFLPQVRARGGQVILAAPAPLLPALENCPGIDRLVVDGDDPGPYDFHLPLLSLPHLLGTTLATLPATVPYLQPSADRVEHWRPTLQAIAGFKVGIVWQGNPKYKDDRRRSVPLRLFGPLAEVPGVALVSLQKGPGEEQKAQVPFRIHDLGTLDAEGAFVDTAALMTLLDLIITVDTATGHLAGALGVPTWLVLAANADWRWLTGREDSPWYPSIRLFRQEAAGVWPPVFDRLAQALRQRCGAASLVPVELAPGELLDKLSILQIKRCRLSNPAKLRHVLAELQALEDAWARCRPERATDLLEELTAVNQTLWDVEEKLRQLESRQDFGARFIELARAVYQNNDRRSRIKQRLNERLGAGFSEQKSFLDC